MKTLLTLFKWTLIAAGSLLVGLTFYAIQAALSLPPGRRPGLPDLTLDQAAQQLTARGLTGWDLVEAARALVGARMPYSRRNSFQPAPLAFRRGYGYCQQHAYALAGLLQRLGFEARVVHALRNRFADGRVTSHAWTQVTLDGESRDFDPLFYDPQARRPAFTPLSPVRPFNPLFRLIAGWGSAIVNAHRYYRTGQDLGV